MEFYYLSYVISFIFVIFTIVNELSASIRLRGNELQNNNIGLHDLAAAWPVMRTSFLVVLCKHLGTKLLLAYLFYLYLFSTVPISSLIALRTIVISTVILGAVFLDYKARLVNYTSGPKMQMLITVSSTVNRILWCYGGVSLASRVEYFAHSWLTRFSYVTVAGVIKASGYDCLVVLHHLFRHHSDFTVSCRHVCKCLIMSMLLAVPSLCLSKQYGILVLVALIFQQIYILV